MRGAGTPPGPGAAISRLARHVPVGAVYLAGLVPVAALAVEALLAGLGADPVKRIEHALGLAALQFLLAGLAITPLLRFAGVNLMRFRRAFGLVAFGLAAAHLAVWVVLDLQFRWSEIAADLTRRPYIIAGMAAFALLVPLALTSSDSALRRLGTLRWRRLHRLVYPAVLLGALHHLLTFKVPTPEAYAYLGIASALVALRLLPLRG